MSRYRSLLRRVAVIATVLLAGTLAAGPARAETIADPVVTPFAADSGDGCPFGFTKGDFAWHRGAGGTWPLVEVKGVVGDRPFPADPGGSICVDVDDGRYTVATFTAYDKSGEIASVAVKADNALEEFSFPIKAGFTVEVIVVQVCRHQPWLLPYDYCGPARKFPAPEVVID